MIEVFEQDGKFVAVCELVGASAEANTEQEALKQCRNAIYAWLKTFIN